MGEISTIERVARLEAEAEVDITNIKEAGGNIAFIFQYLKYINDLRSQDDQPSVALSGTKFRKRAVQLAAVTAMLDMASMSKWKEASHPEFKIIAEGLPNAACAAYVSARHFEDDALSSLPEPGPEAASRRKKAGEDWDRLIDSNPLSLIMLTLFGHEGSKPLAPIDYVKGIASLLFLAAVAVAAYYIWTAIK